MKLGKDRHVSSSPCLGCGRILDGAVYVGEDDKAPDPGSITVCIDCGHIQAFDVDMSFRELTPEEQHDIAGDPRILAVQRARAATEKMEKKGK
jgi:hypothetical protein